MRLWPASDFEVWLRDHMAIETYQEYLDYLDERREGQEELSRETMNDCVGDEYLDYLLEHGLESYSPEFLVLQRRQRRL